MSRLRRRGSAAAVISLALLVAAGAHPGEAELVVRNDSLSTLAIAIVVPGQGEARLGQAPPEFTNTLYFPADVPTEVRFRARLRGHDDVLHESEPVRVRDGARLRWSLPDNVLEVARAPREAARTEG